MQGTVGWDPISINHQYPVVAKLLGVYLFVACGFALGRSVSILRLLKKVSGSTADTKADFLRMAETCSAHIRSIHRLAILSFLTTLLTTTLLVKDLMIQVTMEKRFGLLISGGLSEALMVLAIGLGVCAALYALFACLEGMLSRIKNRRLGTTQ